MELSVVIPTYNEAARLPQTLRGIRPYLTSRFPSHEIVIVDDNSPDGTAAIAAEMRAEYPAIRVLVQPGRLGKGAAVRRGCLAAHGEKVLFMDADHATPIGELESLLPHLARNGPQAVVGVRTYQEDESRWRRILGLFSQILAHLVVFRKAVVDSQCGFKLFSREAIERIFPYLRVNGGMLDVEIFLLLHKFGVPCHYEPVQWVNKAGSRINIPRCMLLDPLDMFRIRLRDMSGAISGRFLKPDVPATTEQPMKTNAILTLDTATPRRESAKWHEAYGAAEEIRRRRRAMPRKLRLLGIDRAPRDSAVLDLCCGRGEALGCLYDLGFRSLAGIDLALASEIRCDDRFDMRLGDAKATPFAANSYDWVLNIHSLHHFGNVAEVDRLLAECYRLLKPGGRLGIVDFSASPQLKLAFWWFRQGYFLWTDYLKNFGRGVQEEWYFLKEYFPQWPQVRALLHEGRFEVEHYSHRLFYFYLTLRKPLAASSYEPA